LSAPCIADGKVYIGYEDKVGSEAFGGVATDKPYAMACFDLHTGAIVWQQWIRGEVMSSPVVEDKKLYFNTFSGHTYVLNRENGDVLAEKQLFGTSAPTIVNGLVCMGQRDAGTPTAMERIAMFDPANNLVLKVATPYQLAPYLDAKAFRKTLLAANADNISLNTGSSGMAIANAGKIGPAELVGRESIFAIQSFEGSRVLHAYDRLYVTQGNFLRCLDVKTLNLVWENDFHIGPSGDGGGTMSPPIGAGGKIIVACTDGILRMVLPGNGIEYMGYETGERQRQQPIAAKGSIFVPCTNGKLTVVKTVFPEVDGWYCWGGNASRKNKAANR
jgi:outer membrane protein assembly factor BamB